MNSRSAEADDENVQQKYHDDLLNLKKFSPIDLKEDQHPLFDEEDERLETDAIMRNSLNSIVKNLGNDGDHSFSDSTIYKVSIPRNTVQLA